MTDETTRSGRRAWPRVLLIVLGVLALLALAAMAMGGLGGHGPWQHAAALAWAAGNVS